MIIIKFVIATISFWSEKGYNTEYWRKSIDGTKAMCHLEYGEILANNLEDNPNVQIFDCASDEFQTLLSSSEWVQGGADELIEDESLASRVSSLEASDTEKDDQIKILTQTIVNMQLDNMMGGE